MKLELRHLAGYLPYGLKGVEEIEKPIHILHSLDIDKKAIWRNKEFHSMTSRIDCIPILRPLSDLTKEIEVNGEKFVPIKEYYYLRFEEISTFKGCCNAMKFIQARELELLYEMHFDIYGLIENNLAIDINGI